MKLIKEQFTSGIFTLLTAPVASGKTKLIVDFYKENDLKIIFISPLRALANEVYKNLSVSERNILLAGGEISTLECFEKFFSKKKSFFISTMELLNEEFLDECVRLEENILFILDEFHLFYHWGEQFRPILHDRFLAILNTNFPVLALTATLNENTKNQLTSDLKYFNDYWVHIDYGNQMLFRTPHKINYFSEKEKVIFNKVFITSLNKKKSNEVFIYFCSYRKEVDEWVDRSRRLGFKALGCVGGEVEDFLLQLNHCLENKISIDCIFSTTTLSHGVNLPEIKSVFISYELKDFDFWLQMAGRGGRKGNPYDVFTFDSYFKKKFLVKDKIMRKLGII